MPNMVGKVRANYHPALSQMFQLNVTLTESQSGDLSRLSIHTYAPSVKKYDSDAHFDNYMMLIN